MSEKLENLRLNIASLCCEVEEMFTEPVYVTCIVRNVHSKNRNVITTNDPDLSKLKDVIDGEGIVETPGYLPGDEEHVCNDGIGIYDGDDIVPNH